MNFEWVCQNPTCGKHYPADCEGLVIGESHMFPIFPLLRITCTCGSEVSLRPIEVPKLEDSNVSKF